MTIAPLAGALLLLVASTLGGCGQKGPLTLDTPPSESPVTPVTEPEEEREEQTSGNER